MRGHYVGIVEHTGYAMTLKILIEATHKIIYRSNIRNVDDTNTPNLRSYLFDGEKTITKFIKYKSDINQKLTMIIMTPDDLSVPSLVNQEMIGRDSGQE